MEANYRGRGRYYPGRVSRVRLNGTMDIDYDDGEKEIGVDRDNVRLAGGSSSPSRSSSDRIEEGSKVEANYRGRGRYYPGRVSRVRLNGTMDIDYDDGEKEIGVDRDNVRLAGGSSIPAGAPVIASRRAPRSRRTTAGEARTTLAVCHACV